MKSLLNKGERFCNGSEPLPAGAIPFEFNRDFIPEGYHVQGRMIEMPLVGDQHFPAIAVRWFLIPGKLEDPSPSPPA